ncbi:unnamed protein product [Alternaria sp. RS040]
MYITNSDLPAFESRNSDRIRAHSIVPALKTSKKDLELADEADPELIFANTKDETTFQTQADNIIDASKTYPDVKHASTSSPDAAMTITKDTTATVISSTLNSSQASSVSMFPSSVATKQALPPEAGAQGSKEGRRCGN